MLDCDSLFGVVYNLQSLVSHTELALQTQPLVLVAKTAKRIASFVFVFIIFAASYAQKAKINKNVLSCF